MTRRAMGGFTLIEIVIVTFILSILGGLAVIRMGGSGRDSVLEEEARRLHALAGLAAEESILQGRPFGMQLQDDGYRVVEYRDGAWRGSEGDPLLQGHRLPQGMTVRARGGSRTRAVKPGVPDIVYLPSGEWYGADTVFEDAPGRVRIRLEVDAYGDYVVRREATGA